MTRARKPSARRQSDPVIGWANDAVRLTAEYNAEWEVLGARWERVLPNEYRTGPGFQYAYPSEFPPDLAARYKAFHAAMGMDDSLEDRRLQTALRLDRKVEKTRSRTLGGLVAKLRLAANVLQLEEGPDGFPLKAATAYAWQGGKDHAVSRLVASIWADAERLIGEGGEL
jgi:hypothetical protein